LFCNLISPMAARAGTENGRLPVAQLSGGVNLQARTQLIFEHKVCKNTRRTLIFAASFKNTVCRTTVSLA
jgi:hypothetical protein